MLKKEALQEIRTLATEAAGVKLIAIPGDATRLILQQMGSNSFVPIPPAPRRHTVHLIADLATLAGNFETDKIVWYNSDSITLVLDDSVRTETAELGLILSPIYKRLQELERGSLLTQRDLIRLLKFDLAEGFSDETLVASIRNVKFRRSVETSQNMTNSRESMGRGIDSEVTCAGSLPERFTVTTPVFCNQELEADVATFELAIEVNFDESKFSIEPFPGQLEEGMNWALDRLCERLGREFGDGATVLRGAL